MKSKLFKSIQAFKEDSFKLETMKGDLAAMLSVGAEKLPVFMKAVRELLSTSVADHDRIAKDTLPLLGIERGTLDHAFNFAGWLATEFYPHGHAKNDSPEAIADDMLTLKMMASDQWTLCVGFVTAIKILVQDFLKAEIEKDRALQRGAPKVVGVDTALFFRNMFRKAPNAEEPK